MIKHPSAPEQSCRPVKNSIFRVLSLRVNNPCHAILGPVEAQKRKRTVDSIWPGTSPEPILNITHTVSRLPPNIPTTEHQHRLPSFLRMNFNHRTGTLDQMNPIADRNPFITVNSNCGNITDSYKNVWNNCDISVADEKRAVLEWLSPLEPRERHQAIGMGRVAGVGDWFLHTEEFTQWIQSGDGTAKPVLFCYGDPGVGKTYLRYGWWLPLKSVGKAKQ